MVATAGSFSNPDLAMIEYLNCLYEDLPEAGKDRIDFGDRIS
jgi:hypothetical protein